jgi:acetoin utilization protein AcuB
MKVSQIMSVNPVSVLLDDHMSVVKEIFDNAKFHHVLVVEEGKLFGVISDRDLLKVISPNLNTSRISLSDLKTLDIPVHRVVTREPITLKPDASVSDAVKIFTIHRISCIPVVDDAGAAVGIISWRDILKHMDHVCADWPRA